MFDFTKLKRKEDEVIRTYLIDLRNDYLIKRLPEGSKFRRDLEAEQAVILQDQ